MKELKITNFDVQIKEDEDLLFLDIENIQKATMAGISLNAQGIPTDIDPSAMLGAKREICKSLITEIKDKDGNKIEFSKEWLDNLKAKDGMKIMEAIDNETKDIVKKKV